MTSMELKEPVEDSNEPDKKVDSGCGWGPFRPKILQPLAKAWTFIVFYLAFSFTHGVQGSYTISVLTTLEKRFNLPSFIAGSLFTYSTIGYCISAVFASFFFAKRNVPRLFTACMLVTSLGAMFYVIPHFIYGTGNDDMDAAHAQIVASNNLSEVSQKSGSEFCAKFDINRSIPTTEPCSEDSQQTAKESVAFVIPAVVMFALGELLQGMAGAPVWSVGLAYIDDHTSPELSAKLIGIMFTLRLGSPMVSFALGGYLLSIYANLKETALTPEHPRWIGAWWMGFLVCSIINFILSVPTSMIPDNLRPITKPPTSNFSAPSAVAVLSSNPGPNASNSSGNEHDEPDLQITKEVDHRGSTSMKVTLPKWKDLPKATVRLLTNPIYIIASIAICIDCFVLGFMTFLPKYFEVHFRKTAWLANLLGGMIPCVFGGCASYIGGIISGKIKGADGGVAGNCRMNVSLSLLSVLLMIPAMLLSCPEVNYSGRLTDDHRLNVTTDCNARCGCSPNVFDPVCGIDGVSYVSPCHAGCFEVEASAMATHNSSHQIIASGCQCVGHVHSGDGGEGAGGAVYSGFCDDGCITLIPYVITLVAIFVSTNMYNVPVTNIILRCINEDDKSFALGLQTLGICLAFLPAPIMFGSVFDSACILRATTKCSDAEGTCLLYDRHALRLVFHGLTMGLRSISTIIYFVTYILAKRKLAQIEVVKEISVEPLKKTDDPLTRESPYENI